MKNVFKIAAIALASLVVVTAKAEALYWQVDPGSSDQEFQYAILNVTGGEFGDSSRMLAGAAAEGTAPNQYVSVQNTDISDYANSSYSFFVEMANYNNNNGSWDVVKAGTPVNYTDLSDYIATSFQEGLDLVHNGGYNMGSSAVPEPTSGLLLLMGGAMLALRRRRQK